MDDFSMFLFFCIMFFTLGFVIGRWFHARDVAAEIARLGLCKTEHEQPTPEPGTLGKRPNYRAVALLDQMDALLVRLNEAELDQVIDEMQRRTW